MPQFKKHFSPVLSIKKATIITSVKWCITLAVLYYVYYYITDEGKQIENIVSSLKQVFIPKNTIWIILVVILVPINWALESWKWQGLAKRVYPLTYLDAIKSTLMGIVGSVLVPAQLGEVVGKISSLPTRHKGALVGASIVSSGVQYYISLVFGWIGMVYLEEALELSPQVMVGVHFVFFVLLVIGVFAYLWSRKPAAMKGWWKRFRKNIEVISDYSPAELITALGIGFTRYTVYVIQFLLAVYLWKPDIGFPDLLASVVVLYLIKTVIPSLNFLGDWGLRGVSALYVLGQFNIPSEQILAITFLIWAVNLLLPVLIGLVVLWRLNWTKTND